MKKQVYPYIVLAVLAIPLFFINIHALHGWGDDFAQYIKQAMNIAAGKPFYESNYIFNPNHHYYGPPQYPPGFSILLAPIVAIWGLSFKHMLYLIAACLTAILFSLFAFYRRYTNDITAACMSLICVYAGGIVELKNQVLSDIPCWMFVCIYFAIRKSGTLTSAKIAWMVLAATMAMLTRTQAASLLIAEGIYLLIAIPALSAKSGARLKALCNSVSFKVPLFTVLLYGLLSATIFRTPGSTLDFYMQLINYRENNSFWTATSENISYLHDLLVRSFHYYPNGPLLYTISNFAIYMLLSSAIIGFIMTARKKLEVSHIYFLIVCLLLILLSQRQGIRFMLYLMPFILLYTHRALQACLPRLLNIKPVRLGVIMTIAYLFLGKDDFIRYTVPTPADFIPTQKDSVAFSFIRANISDTDLIIFSKPRALTLFTNKRSIVASKTLSYADNKAHFDKIPGRKYLLVSDALGYEMNEYYAEAPKYAADTFDMPEGYHFYLLR